MKQMSLQGIEVVLYCDLDRDISDDDLTAERLAGFAIESVRRRPERNGIRYLVDNIERNLITPLTCAYRDVVLRLTGANDLAEAERRARGTSRD